MVSFRISTFLTLFLLLSITLLAKLDYGLKLPDTPTVEKKQP